MSKVYGVRCDACKDKISGPADHFKITLKGELGFIVPETNDLCRSCYEQARELLQEWAKSKRPTIQI